MLVRKSAIRLSAAFTMLVMLALFVPRLVAQDILESYRQDAARGDANAQFMLGSLVEYSVG